MPGIGYLVKYILAGFFVDEVLTKSNENMNQNQNNYLVTFLRQIPQPWRAVVSALCIGGIVFVPLFIGAQVLMRDASTGVECTATVQNSNGSPVVTGCAGDPSKIQGSGK